MSRLFGSNWALLFGFIEKKKEKLIVQKTSSAFEAGRGWRERERDKKIVTELDCWPQLKTEKQNRAVLTQDKHKPQMAIDSQKPPLPP